MSLNWSLKDCKDADRLCNASGSEKPVDILQWKKTEALIWATLSLGLSNITEENYKEFWLRVNMTENYEGPWMGAVLEDNKRMDIYFSLQDIKDRIGMYTNAETLTFNQWMKKKRKVWYEGSEVDCLGSCNALKNRATDYTDTWLEKAETYEG
tara:strand:- start:5157 stop:5615 length:459 start_codon:yes stop_codon:yes gene_type:complete